MKVICPACKKEIEYSEKNSYRPFCSERCKLLDLGDWAQEKFSVPTSEDSSQPSKKEEED
jgi:endogenous inhibitor of DNA gyrase (YacG/DUF329 family)